MWILNISYKALLTDQNIPESCLFFCHSLSLIYFFLRVFPAHYGDRDVQDDLQQQNCSGWACTVQHIVVCRCSRSNVQAKLCLYSHFPKQIENIPRENEHFDSFLSWAGRAGRGGQSTLGRKFIYKTDKRYSANSHMLFSLAAVELVQQAVCCLRVITHCAFKPGRQLWPNNLLPFY